MLRKLLLLFALWTCVQAHPKKASKKPRDREDLFLTTVPGRFIATPSTAAQRQQGQETRILGVPVLLRTTILEADFWEQAEEDTRPLTLPPAMDNFDRFQWPADPRHYGPPGARVPGDAYEPHTLFPNFTRPREFRGRYDSATTQLEAGRPLFDMNATAPVYDQLQSPFNAQGRSNTQNMHAIVYMDRDTQQSRRVITRYNRHVVYVHGQVEADFGDDEAQMWSVTTIGDETPALYNIVARANTFPDRRFDIAGQHLRHWQRLERLDLLFRYLEIQRPPHAHSILYNGYIPVYTTALSLAREQTADNSYRISATPQLVWINPLEILVDTIGHRGLVAWAQYRTRVCDDMVYDGFYLDVRRGVPPLGMLPFMLHPIQPTRPLSNARAWDLFQSSRVRDDDVEYRLLIRMLNRLEDHQFSRRDEWTVGDETVYRHVENVRGFVRFGHRTLRINDEPFRNVIDGWYQARQTGAAEPGEVNRMFGAVAQIIIDLYTNLRLPDFQGYERPPTLAMQHGGVLPAYDWLLTQATRRAHTYRQYVNSLLTRWDPNFPTMEREAEWEERVAAEPPEDEYLDYAPVPPIDRPQAFTPSWRNGENSPIPDGMMERVAEVRNRDQFQALDQERRRNRPEWPLENYVGVYGHDDEDGCWFTTACEACPRPNTGVAMYGGRGGGQRQMDAHLRTVQQSPEFRAAIEMGPKEEGEVIGKMETRGEEDFEDDMSE
jgi:hypothetical protein